MNNQSSIAMRRPPNRALGLVLSFILLLDAVSATTIAHGGFDHLRGTVIKVANNVLTVKTATGNVDVKLDNQTELTKNDQKAQFTDLKPGTRVIVDMPEGSKDKIAHSVKIGALTKIPDEHKHAVRR